VSAAPVSTSARIESAEAANELYEQYHDRIYAFCLSRTRNPADAEDATQTAFMHALNGLRRGVVPQFELTWLLKIAENVCHSMHRRAYRRYERDELPEDVASGQEDLSLVTERYDALCHALESLPDQQRRAILLREWRGLSYDDIADELGVTHAAVETTLFRARRTLVKQIGSLAVFPVPLVGRFAQWAAGSAGAKVAAVAVVTIGTATAVVSSAPVDDARRPARVGSANVAALTSVDRAGAVTSARAPVVVDRAGAPEATVAVPAARPAGVDTGEAPAPAPSSPNEPRPEPPAASPEPPASVVDAPSVVPPLPVLPVQPTEVLPTAGELTEDVDEILPVDLPKLPPLPPVAPGLPLP
jgi:RNA polymerase sigma-70 factor (ECF subfamily)